MWSQPRSATMWSQRWRQPVRVNVKVVTLVCLRYDSSVAFTLIQLIYNRYTTVIPLLDGKQTGNRRRTGAKQLRAHWNRTGPTLAASRMSELSEFLFVLLVLIENGKN